VGAVIELITKTGTNTSLAADEGEMVGLVQEAQNRRERIIVRLARAHPDF